MKKTKTLSRLSFLSLLLAALLLLSSCGSTVVWDGLLRTDTGENGGVEALTKIEELDNYVLFDKNDGFAFFRQKDAKSGFFTYKVLSLHSESVVLTVTESHTDSYSFRTPSLSLGAVSRPVFFLISTTTAGTETYTLYDGAGTMLAPVDAALAEDPVAFGDAMLYNGALYRQSTAGKIEKVRDVPESLILPSPDAVSENYYYYRTAEGITVYNADFTFAAAWRVPVYHGYSAPSFNYFVLNNGDVLIQYRETLPEEAEEYDVITTGSIRDTKVRLHSLLFSVEKNSVEELSLDYTVSSLTNEYSEKLLYGRDSYPYADGFENIAIILPIRDKRIISSEKQTVLLDNNGEIKSSLMLIDEQTTEIPERIGEDLFLVETNYGRVITNAEGEIVHALNNDTMQIVGSYIVGESAIYDLNMEKVYDLAANGATVCGVLASTVFVEKINARQVEILSFTDGKMQSVANYALGNDDFNILDELYRVEDATVSRYHYYTPRGKWLLASSGSFEKMAAGPSAGLYRLEESGTVTYYFLK